MPYVTTKHPEFTIQVQRVGPFDAGLITPCTSTKEAGIALRMLDMVQIEAMESIAASFKGGPGSGNFGHAGRPGIVGGSARMAGEIDPGMVDKPSFKKWFGDSKVVDDHGNPKVVYHGSSKSFTAFDPKRADSGALYGPGFYFTDDTEIAGGLYGDETKYNPESQSIANSYGLAGYAFSGMTHKLDRPINEKDMKGVRHFLNLKSELGDAASDIGIRAMWNKAAQLYNNHDLAGMQKYLEEDASDRLLKRLGLTRSIAGTPTVYPVYLSIKNPFDMSTEVPLSTVLSIKKAYNKDYGPLKNGDFDLPEVKGMQGHELFDILRQFTNPEVRANPNYYAKSNDLANNVLRSAGYDGIKYTGGQVTGGKAHQVWIAFEPGQVKSALGNTGEFNPAEVDITKEVTEKGGPGSGNFGHVGRPGKVGGSAESHGIGAGELPDEGLEGERDFSVKDPLIRVRKGMEYTGMDFATATARHEYLPYDKRVSDFLSENVDAGYWDTVIQDKWARVTDEGRAKIKEDIVNQIYDRVPKDSGIMPGMIAKAIYSWAGSSNDSSLASLSMQQAASEEFGVQMSDWQKKNLTPQLEKVGEVAKRADELRNKGVNSSDSFDILSKEFGSVPPEIESHLDEGQGFWDDVTAKYHRVGSRKEERTILRTMYNNTQNALSSLSGGSRLNYVTVYRGVSPDAIHASPFEDLSEIEGKSIEYRGNSIESWSVSPAIAGNFGGVILAARIPRKRVLSTAKTGYGCITEGELTVLGMSDPGIKVTVAYVAYPDR